MWAQKMCLGEKSKPNMLKYSGQKNVFHSSQTLHVFWKKQKTLNKRKTTKQKKLKQYMMAMNFKVSHRHYTYVKKKLLKLSVYLLINKLVSKTNVIFHYT